MCTKKSVIIFLSGAEAMHTIVHIGIAMFGLAPITLPFMTITPGYNTFAIVFNGIISLGFLYWASKLKK